MVGEDVNRPVLHPKSNGPLFSLEMLLDVPRDSSRLISVHSPKETPDLLNEPIEIEAG